MCERLAWLSTINIEFTVKIFQVLIALAGFLFGLRQYNRTQTYNRVSFSSDVLDRFYKDENVIFALRILDWTERKFKLPDKFNQSLSGGARLDHSQKKIVRSVFDGQQSAIQYLM